MILLKLVAFLTLFFVSCLCNDCDPISSEYCMLPFPNDFWRVQNDDGSYNLAFTNQTFPIDRNGEVIDPEIAGLNDLDGFSTFSAITIYFDDIDESSIEKCGRLWNISQSLSSDSPIQLFNSETGELVPHWVELDFSSEHNLFDKHAILIWPASQLDFSTNYIVVIQNTLQNKYGESIQPSNEFKSLRDRLVTKNPLIEKRRHHFEVIFQKINTLIKIERTDVLLTWDFTTGSRDSITHRMLSARDDARTRVGENGPSYRILEVEYNYSDHIDRVIKGVFEMPLYLTTRIPTKHARLVLDDDGNVVYQRYADYQFIVMVPKSVINNATLDQTKSRVVQYGHGLFGSPSEVLGGYLQEVADRYGYIMVACEWVGLANQNLLSTLSILAENLNDFITIPDTTTQGMTNALGLMQMMKGSFSQDPVMMVNGESIVDTEKLNYYGNSEGGIFGMVYMALTQDVERGLLGVPGGPYGLLLPRSVDFSYYFDVLKGRYLDPVDRINLLQVMQLLWDRAEPAGYMNAVSTDPLENTPAHRVIFHYGLGDAQVSWLGAQSMARSVGSVMFESNVREGNETFFGFDMVDDMSVLTEGNAIVGFDFGSPEVPFVNIPPDDAYDTHEDPRRDTRAQEMMNHFFVTGEIINTCDGPCTSS